MFEYCEKKRKCRAHVRGEMTIYNASALKDKLVGILDDRRSLEIDLSEVTEIDSAGIQLLMLARKECERRGRVLSLRARSDAVTETFRLLGLAACFDDASAPDRPEGKRRGA